eukprot:Amastigsp_a8039_21.p4 type:complete len:174 gc:universal Amastigsp_a8039_21:889-368(-)
MCLGWCSPVRLLWLSKPLACRSSASCSRTVRGWAEPSTRAPLRGFSRPIRGAFMTSSPNRCPAAGCCESRSAWVQRRLCFATSTVTTHASVSPPNLSSGAQKPSASFKSASRASSTARSRRQTMRTPPCALWRRSEAIHRRRKACSLSARSGNRSNKARCRHGTFLSWRDSST